MRSTAESISQKHGSEEKSSITAVLVKETMEARLEMEGFFKRFLLRLFFIAFLYFLLASSSLAQQKSPSQFGENSFFTFGQEVLSEESELPPLEQETPLEKEESPAPEQKIPSKEKKEFLTRGQKTLLLNAGSMAAIAVYGLTKWDYGKSSFNFQDEGWFERDTKSGGADKLGHFWSSYALSHLYSYAYHKWGYRDQEANLYGSLSSLGVNLFMEVADGFSPSQGFSYEDGIMNIVGCGIGYIWGEYPSLAKKIDFRIEYTPEFNSDDFGLTTNYERQRFLIALKADGFDFIKNRYLRYLELHVGYYARGFEDHEEGGLDNRRRKIYVGLGFNVSKLAQKFVHTRVLDYIQIPYTSVYKGFKLD